MPSFCNSKGEWFHRGSGGCYPINDGDPQNDDPDFDAEEAKGQLDDDRDYYENR